MAEKLHNVAKRFGASFEGIKSHLDTALASAADPERSLIYLERLLESEDESLIPALEKNPRVIESLVTIFSGSQFLTEIILRNPKNVNLLHHRNLLTQRKSTATIHMESSKIINEANADQKLDAL